MMRALARAIAGRRFAPGPGGGERGRENAIGGFGQRGVLAARVALEARPRALEDQQIANARLEDPRPGAGRRDARDRTARSCADAGRRRRRGGSTPARRCRWRCPRPADSAPRTCAASRRANGSVSAPRCSCASALTMFFIVSVGTTRALSASAKLASKSPSIAIPTVSSFTVCTSPSRSTFMTRTRFLP